MLYAAICKLNHSYKTVEYVFGRKDREYTLSIAITIETINIVWHADSFLHFT